ncbi:MAG: DNA-directed RNA polymerase subunit alpha C-terminal domain-containing protein [Tetrasphaera sp.]
MAKTKATPADVDAIAAGLPGTELGISWGDRPTRKVGGKGFLLYHAPHKTAIDPESGELYTDLLVVHTPDMEAKAALLGSGGSFFDIDHFRTYAAVLVQLSRLGEFDRDDLVEVITDAWAAKAPKRLVAQHFGEPVDPFEDLAARARRALAGAGIRTLAQLRERTDEELLALHGVGAKALQQAHALD